MNAFTSIMKNIGSSYREVLVEGSGISTIRTGFHTAKNEAAKQTTTRGKIGAAAKASTHTGAAFFRAAAANVAGTMVAMEVVDYIEARVSSRRREVMVNAIVHQLGRNLTESNREEMIQDLRRQTLPPRRTFGQFARDLPNRTVRRIYRACLFEAGFWYGALTSPLWLTALAAYGAYAFALVAPYALFREVFTDHVVDTAALLDRPGLFTRAILRATAGRSYRLMAKAMQMTMYDKTALYTNKYSKDILDEVAVETFEETGDITNRVTAYNWGQKLAQGIATREALDTMAKQSVLAVFQSWSVDYMAGDFVDDVQAGFKDGTPFYLRDLVGN